MDQPVRKRVVVSAVNIRKGGTLTVLKECLEYLSGRQDLEVIALVHKQALCDYPGIRYIEMPWTLKSWFHRLWCEYVTMHKVSKEIGDIDLWLSLHDTTPRVEAKAQAVYCHTSFPFLKVHARDWQMDPKIPLFACFTRFAYRIGVKRNRYLIVQQEWFREGLSRLVGFPEERIIVAPPQFQPVTAIGTPDQIPLFFYPSSPDCHKNFETLCMAAELLEKQLGTGKFQVVLTVKGDENRYACWLNKQWGSVSSIDFHGFMLKEELASYYGRAACLVFPSRVETWGLPISEFKPTGRPMILADLPYAHESATEVEQAAIYEVEDYRQLAGMMLQIIQGIFTNFVRLLPLEPHSPYAASWDDMFDILLDDANSAAR